MATFVHIKEQDLWINLDYVVRIERGVDEADGATVTMADGSTLSVSKADSKRLFKHLLPRKKKKKKKKKEAVPVAAGVEEGQTPAAG